MKNSKNKAKKAYQLAINSFQKNPPYEIQKSCKYK